MPPGSVISSRSGASRVSTGSTARPTGFIDRLSKKYKNPFFSLLVTLVKDSEPNAFALVLLIVDWLQMLDFAFDGYNWGKVPGERWKFIVGLSQFESLLVETISFEGLIALISVVLALTIVLVGLAYYVFSGFFKGSFKAGITPVRILRFLVSVILSMGFLPLYVPLLAIFSCSHNHKTREGYPSCTDPLNMTYIILASLGILVLLPFTFLASMTYFKPNPKTNSLDAKPNPRLELFELFAKLVLSTIHHFLREQRLLRSVIFFAFATSLCFNLYFRFAYYHRTQNFIKFILGVQLVWAATCTVFVAGFDSNDKGHIIMVVYFVGIPFNGVGAYYIFRRRWIKVTNTFCPLPKAESATDIEMAGKGLQEADADRIAHTRFKYPWMVENATRFLTENSSEHEVRRAELLYRRGIELFPEDTGLLVCAALFFMAYRNDTTMAIMLCQKVLKNHPPLVVEFTVFYLRRGGIFEDSSGNRLDLVDQLDFKHLNKRAKAYHDDARKKIGLFWRQLLTDQSPAVQVRLLNQLASQIHRAERHAASAYEQLCNRFPVGRHWIAYANFIEEVQHDVRRADFVYGQYETLISETEEADDMDERTSSGGGSGKHGRLGRRHSSSSGGKVTRLAGQSRKERRAYREYHRQIMGLKSVALERMGMITKGLMLLLAAVALAEFVYLIVTTNAMHGRIETLARSAYRREAAVIIPQTLRQMEAAARGGDLATFEVERQKGFSTVDPLSSLQRTLFFEKMNDPLEKEFWTIPTINISIYRPNADLGDSVTFSLMNLFDASTDFTAKSLLALMMPPLDLANSSVYHDDANWRFVMQNAPNSIASAFSLATYLFMNDLHSQTLSVFYVQGGILVFVAIAVLLVGLFLFTPTMLQVREERDKSLLSFTKIPRHVIEKVYFKYADHSRGGAASKDFSDEDDLGQSDSEDEEDADEDAYTDTRVESAHTSVYVAMNKWIWFALLLVIVLFVGFFVGSYFTLAPLVDIATRINLSLRIRFGAMRAHYLVNEFINRDYVLYPTHDSIFDIILGDLETGDSFRKALILGISDSLVSVQTTLDPQAQLYLFERQYLNNTLSINDATILLSHEVRSLASRSSASGADPTVFRTLAAANLVSDGMGGLAVLLQDIYEERSGTLKAVTGAILGGMVIFLILIYSRLFRKLVRMLEHDKQSTLQLLLLIPPEAAMQMDIVGSLKQENTTRRSWLPWQWGIRGREEKTREDGRDSMKQKDVPVILVKQQALGASKGEDATHEALKENTSVAATRLMEDKTQGEVAEDTSQIFSTDELSHGAQIQHGRQQEQGWRRSGKETRTRPHVRRSISTPAVSDQSEMGMIKSASGLNPVEEERSGERLGRRHSFGQRGSAMKKPGVVIEKRDGVSWGLERH